ncbi:hypothetical protein NSK_002148 [Nannochloropsis salina CCMP1776]|uniref:Sulfotransferase domain-containing protein n=1 Tax=Nannochloropsis salina CCMP1776 TaxID=1027361 RepID=A0A4D9D425_9STRA|nr:hypothetical protein NSK_002148 [Nannochloropsis salina CCMP1776]|eukprot:TFJ86491.1 hypothetical protein NSK_002148 [Nannochloropsis salina CCMP1776]
MLRTLLEGVTGIVTGSDTRPDRVLSRSLLKRGLRGEGVVDERAWIVKSHWPERHGYRRFPVQRIILLVRNPFDAIYSYFNMGLTNTHEERLASDVFESLAPLWEDMARNEARVWAKFNAYWLTQKLPVLVVRYEDLLLHTEEMLVRLVSFLESTPREAIRASRSHMARIAKSAAAVRSPPITPPISSSELVLDGPRGEDQAPPAAAATAAGSALPAYSMRERRVSLNTGTQRGVRDRADRFGRGITSVRHELTDHDRRPLRTVSAGDSVRVK